MMTNSETDVYRSRPIPKQYRAEPTRKSVASTLPLNRVLHDLSRPDFSLGNASVDHSDVLLPTQPRLGVVNAVEDLLMRVRRPC